MKDVIPLLVTDVFVSRHKQLFLASAAAFFAAAAFQVPSLLHALAAVMVAAGVVALVAILERHAIHK